MFVGMFCWFFKIVSFMYLPVPESGRSHDGDAHEVCCGHHDIPYIVSEGFDSA